MTSVTAPAIYLSTPVNDLSPRCSGVMFDDTSVTVASAAATAAAVVSGGSRGNSYHVPVSMSAGIQTNGIIAERRERVLLRPWLENLIESGTVPGLEWIDELKTMFKVPWKHRSKKNWSLLHSCVFLEWAKNTGRWAEGDPEPNYAQLKTRLRCAFNKAPDIQEMKALHVMKCDEPYKVYRFTARRDGKSRPFARTFVTRASVPLASRRRRRRPHHPPPTDMNPSKNAVLSPDGIKYEPVVSSSSSLGESVRLMKMPKDDTYYNSSEYTWKNELLSTEHMKMSRSLDLADMPMSEHHGIPLAVEVENDDEDLKPIIAAATCSPRRILPKADAGFDFYQPRCLPMPQFRSQSRPQKSNAGVSRETMASHLLVLHAASVAADGSQEEDRNSEVAASDCYRGRISRPAEYSVSSPFASVTSRAEKSSTTLIPAVSPASTIQMAVETYDARCQQRSIPSDPSVTSLSPVSSEPSDTCAPCGSFSPPTKHESSEVRVDDDVSAPRLRRFIKRYQQQQQLIEENELREKNRKNCELSEFSQPLIGQQKSSEPNASPTSQSSKMPVARALPLIAITDSIAMLNFGKRMSPCEEVDEKTLLEQRYTTADVYCTSSSVDAFIPSPRMSYRTGEGVQGQCWSKNNDWHSGEMNKIVPRYESYESDFKCSQIEYPTTVHPFGSEGNQLSDCLEEKLLMKYGHHTREDDYCNERDPRQQAFVPVKQLTDHNGSVDSLVSYRDKIPLQQPSDVVDLTTSINCTDAIDLSLRAPNTEADRRQMFIYRASPEQLFVEESKRKMVGSAVPSVVNELDLVKYEETIRHRTELIASKSALLVDRERQLEQLEKQLAAREEALVFRHEHRNTASPTLCHPPSHTVRMLPYTGESGRCPATLPMRAVPSSERYGGEMPNYINNRRYGFASEGDRVTGELLKTKRARLVDTCDEVHKSATIRGNAQQGQRVYEMNCTQPPVYMRRPVSDAGSDNIPSPTSLTPPSAESDWIQSHPLKHSPVSPSHQRDAVLMNRKRGRPRGSKNRIKFDVAFGRRASDGVVAQSPISNGLTTYRPPNAGGVYESKVYDESQVFQTNRISPESVRGSSSFYNENASMSVTTAATKKLSAFSGVSVFSSETNKVSTADYQSSADNSVSASMPATVRQLVKSAAGTTGASILPPLSPGLENDRYRYGHTTVIDSKAGRNLQNLTSMDLGKNVRYEGGGLPTDCVETVYGCDQLGSRFTSEVSHVGNSSACVGKGCVVPSREEIVDRSNYKTWAGSDGFVDREGAVSWQSQLVLPPRNAESRVVDHGSYSGCDLKILPEFMSVDAGETWNSEQLIQSALRRRRLDLYNAAASDYTGNGGRVINLEAE